MWCIVQKPRVFKNALDLGVQRLRGIGLWNSVMTIIQTYCPENHDSLQARSEGHEDRWWKVAYNPDKD